MLFIQDWIDEVKDKEKAVNTALEEANLMLEKVTSLELEVDSTAELPFKMEKIPENEAKLAMLLGEQAALRMDCVNLKRKEEEKRAQLRAARVSLRDADDLSRKAQADMLAKLCSKALVISKERSTTAEPSCAGEQAVGGKPATAGEPAVADKPAALIKVEDGKFQSLDVREKKK